jgi:hypothetical protein
LEFVSFLFKKFWWLILFIWQDVLHPTIFWLAKLIWHYPIGFSWRFFEFSFRNISEVHKKESLLFGLKKLLALGGLASVLVILHLVYPSHITLFVGLLLFIFVSQYTAFLIAGHHRSKFGAEKILPGIKAMILWSATSLLAAMLLMIMKEADVYVVSALGVAVGQILIPVAILGFIAFLTSMTNLAGYLENTNEVNVTDYLKQLLLRLPKLVYAQPFQLIGMFIVGIVPFAIMAGLNFGISNTTGKDFTEWASEVESIENPVTSVIAARNKITENDSAIARLTSEISSTSETYENSLLDIEEKINSALELKEDIRPGKIHTFGGDVLVGERQFFSIPKISQCDAYIWAIEKDGNKIFEKTVVADSSAKSVSFYHRWNAKGQYSVSLIPTNRCGKGQSDIVFVNVIASKQPIARPQGKTRVCENEKVTYKTAPGYDSYQWRHPFGETTTSKAEIALTWMNSSGTIQVRGQKDNGETTLWTGTDVFVKSLPFSNDPVQNFIENETYEMERAFAFITREAASDSINNLEDAALLLKKERETVIADKELQMDNARNETTALAGGMSVLPPFIGRVLACLGLMLAMVFSICTIYPYSILYHFDLYGFKQDGVHYWRQTLNEMRERNPSQPLLGIFILLFVVAGIALMPGIVTLIGSM